MGSTRIPAGSFPERSRRRPCEHQQHHFRRSLSRRQKQNSDRCRPRAQSVQLGPNSHMSAWSLTQLLAGLHEDIEQRLANARKSFGHAPTKGDASESVWLDLLTNYLPQRYRVATAHVVDSEGNFSDQIDLVVFDR